MNVVLATVRGSVADFVLALVWVYWLVIVAYILTNLAFAAGLRVPYTRWSDGVLGFLRDVTEPYLRLFRRILPSMGGFDLSPVLALVLLQLVGQLVSGAIR